MPVEPEDQSVRLFVVKLARPVIQTTVVTLSAADEDEACRVAMERAAALPDGEWVGKFDGDCYPHDIQFVIDLQEEEMEYGSETLKMRCRPDDVYPDDVYYALLRADVDTGEGALLIPPWLERESLLMAADVVGDWVADLQRFEDEVSKSTD